MGYQCNGAMTLTESQMLALWRRMKGYADVRDDADVDRYDGTDVDTQLLDEIHAWHDTLLDRGALDEVVITDISPEMTVERRADGTAWIALPAGVRRVVEVTAGGHAVRVVDADSDQARRQSNRFARSAVAVVHHDRLDLPCLDPFPDVTTLDSCLVVAEPAEGIYRFMPKALPFNPLTL